MKEEKLNIDWDLISSILDNSANDEEQLLFKNWLNNDTNKQYFNEIKANWEITGDLSYCYDNETNEVWEKVARQTVTKPQKVRKINVRMLQIAATILVLVTVGVYLFSENRQKLVSNNSIIENYLLPDNSTVSLNKNSKLLYAKEFEGKKREVWLEGEAFFSVKRDTSKPFIVNVGNSLVQVLGTSFNINECNKQFIELTVKEGKVKFEVLDLNKSVIVEKGQSAKYDIKRREIIRLDAINVNYLAWKTKVLKFKKTPLTEVVLCLNKVYGKEITIKNDALKELKFSASFNNQSLNKILKVLALTFDIEIKEVKQTIELHQQEK